MDAKISLFMKRAPARYYIHPPAPTGVLWAEGYFTEKRLWVIKVKDKTRICGHRSREGLNSGLTYSKITAHLP